MSHFESELFSEHLNNWRMLVYLEAGRFFHHINCIGSKINRRDASPPVVPKQVHSSISNGIPPIRD